MFLSPKTKVNSVINVCLYYCKYPPTIENEGIVNALFRHSTWNRTLIRMDYTEGSDAPIRTLIRF